MTVSKSPAAARMTLLITWVVGFITTLANVVYLYMIRWIEQPNFTSGLKQTSTLYAPYLGAIITFYLTLRNRDDRSSAVAGPAFGIAVIASVVWNVGVIVLVLRVRVSEIPIETVLDDLGTFSSTFSWLVAPAIGYYFANSSAKKD